MAKRMGARPIECEGESPVADIPNPTRYPVDLEAAGTASLASCGVLVPGLFVMSCGEVRRPVSKLIIAEEGICAMANLYTQNHSERGVTVEIRSEGRSLASSSHCLGALGVGADADQSEQSSPGS